MVNRAAGFMVRLKPAASALVAPLNHNKRRAWFDNSLLCCFTRTPSRRRTTMGTGWTIIILLVLAATGIGFVVAGRKARTRAHLLEEVQAEHDAVVAEERRLFSFLHVLGAVIGTDQRESTLHRMIVEGAMKVTGSKGGCLYAFDDTQNVLVPRFCSDEVSPLIDLSDKVLAQAAASPHSLLSTVRLQVVPAAEGVLGGVFSGQKPERLSDLGGDSRLGSTPNLHQRQVAVMIGPLISGNRRLGVLAVTGSGAGGEFSDNDFEVFASLAEQSAFALANATAHREAQTKRQMEEELRNASEVQRILLPERDPVLDGWAVAGRNRAASVLSGDFYDYVPLGDSRLGAVIADVCGKGVPAALIAATTRSALQAHALAMASPAAVLGAVNRQVSGDITQDKFVSMIYLTVELGGDRVRLACAGHPNPFLWRKHDNTVEVVKCPGLAIGIDDGEVFERVTKRYAGHTAVHALSLEVPAGGTSTFVTSR